MPLPLLNLLIFAFTAWLGLYLIARDRSKSVLVYTGMGLVAYALSLALNSLFLLDFQLPLSYVLQMLAKTLLFVPALCWFGATLYLLPEGTLPNEVYGVVRYAVPALIGIIFLLLRRFYPLTSNNAIY